MHQGGGFTTAAVGRARRPRAFVARRLGAVGVVARRAEIGDARGGDLVDRLGDRAFLVGQLGQVADVVDDHLGAGVGQFDDVVGEGRLAALGRVEHDRRTRRDVVDDLGHGPAFVRAAREVMKDAGRGRQVACGDIAGHMSRGRGVGVEAVGEDADRHPRAAEAEVRSGGVRVERGVGLGGDRPREGH